MVRLHLVLLFLLIPLGMMSAHVHSSGVRCAESFGTEETLIGFLARVCGTDMVLLVTSVGKLPQANRALVL